MKTQCIKCEQPFPFHALDCQVIAGPLDRKRDVVVLLVTAGGMFWEILKVKALRLTGNWRPEHQLIARRIIDQATVALDTLDLKMKELRGE